MIKKTRIKITNIHYMYKEKVQNYLENNPKIIKFFIQDHTTPEFYWKHAEWRVRNNPTFHFYIKITCLKEHESEIRYKLFLITKGNLL